MEYITLHADVATLFFYFILSFSLSLSLCLHMLIYRPLYLSITSCSALRLFYLYPDLDLINHSCVIHCISQLHDFSISPTLSLSLSLFVSLSPCLSFSLYLFISPTPSLSIFYSPSPYTTLLLFLPSFFHSLILSQIFI